MPASHGGSEKGICGEEDIVFVFGGLGQAARVGLQNQARRIDYLGNNTTIIHEQIEKEMRELQAGFLLIASNPTFGIEVE
jgi:hypothetical protein